VQGHLASIFSNLGAQSRTDAVMIGLRLRLIIAPSHE
jgi:DNA-binding NarL/FixJ family response regulator